MRPWVLPGLVLVALAFLHTPAWADRLEEIEKKLQAIGQQQQKLQEEQQRLLQEIQRLKTERESIPKGHAKEKLSEEELEEVAAGQAPGQAAPAQAEKRAPGAARQAGGALAQAGVTPFRVTGVEIQEAAPGSAIIRIQADQPVGRYKAFTLPDPPRIVIDFPEAYLGRRMPMKQAGKGSIREIRSSQYRRKPRPIVRVVLELLSVLPYKVESVQETVRVFIGQAAVKAPPRPPAVPAEKPKPLPEVAKPAIPEQPPPPPPAEPEPPTIARPPVAEERAPEAEEPAQVEEPPQISIERALIERGGLLLRPGQLEITPAVDYNFFDTRRISVSGLSVLPTLVIGVLETEKVQRHIVDPSLTLRLGVVKDLQAEARVPYRFTFDRISTETTEETKSLNGIGDIEGAVFYQPVREWGWAPDVILGVRGKSRTGEDPFDGDPDDLPLGTGFYSLTGSITGVKSSDPAVLFVTVEYTHNFDRTVRLLETDAFRTEVHPGDSIGYNVGVALALNPELAISFRMEQRFVSETETKSKAPGSSRKDVPGSTLNVASAFMGITWAISRQASMDVSVGVGLTEDSPDVTVKMAFPIRLDLF